MDGWVCSPGAKFSLVVAKNQSVNRAIGVIADKAWTPCTIPAPSKIPR